MAHANDLLALKAITVFCSFYFVNSTDQTSVRFQFYECKATTPVRCWLEAVFLFSLQHMYVQMSWSLKSQVSIAADLCCMDSLLNMLDLIKVLNTFKFNTRQVDSGWYTVALWWISYLKTDQNWQVERRQENLFELWKNAEALKK